MKKYLAGMLIAVGAIVVSAMPSWAFQSVKITTITASVTTGGTKTADFTAIIRNVATPFTGTAAAITWSGVNPLSTQWKIADQLVVINSTVIAALLDEEPILFTAALSDLAGNILPGVNNSNITDGTEVTLRTCLLFH